MPFDILLQLTKLSPSYLSPVFPLISATVCYHFPSSAQPHYPLIHNSYKQSTHFSLVCSILFLLRQCTTLCSTQRIAHNNKVTVTQCTLSMLGRDKGYTFKYTLFRETLAGKGVYLTVHQDLGPSTDSISFQQSLC